MKSYIQILGAGTPDGGGPAILIFFDDERYLLNCGEGLQRFAGEHRIKLGKLSHIFLSRLDWDCVGGIPGLISTLADAGGCPHLQIVGPRNTQHFVAAMRPFLQRANFSVKIDELSEDSTNSYADSKLKISVIELKSKTAVEESESPSSKKRKSDPAVEAVAVENLDVLTVSPGNFLLKMFKDPSKYGTMVAEEVLEKREHYRCVEHDRMTSASRLPLVKPTNSSLVWCIEGPETPGKFMAQRAKELGVPHGPLNGLLAKGETIELPDGRLITPEMCIGPVTPGPVFIFLDVPSMEHAYDLMTKLENIKSKISMVTLVIHYVPREVYESEVYAKGMFIEWPANVTHVHLEESYQASLESPSIIQSKLSNHEIYKMPWNSAPFSIQPLTKFNWIGSAKTRELLDLTESLEFTDRMKLYKNLPRRYFDRSSQCFISILGTGAALPGKYRNVSSTLLTFPTVSVLLDCGEGTTGQISRCHGICSFEQIMKSIKVVIISHLHADHHAGMIGFLRERNMMELNADPITIVAPQRYNLWLQEYNECVPIGRYSFVSCEDLMASPFQLTYDISVQAIPVEHCPRSFGFLLNSGKFKAVYSGDTRPCQALITAGQGADLLIHEATMGDDLEAEAIDKRHSTVSEAISVGKRMQAKHILLNHFSQRYSKTAPPLPPNSDNVSVAFDLMTIPVEKLNLIEGTKYNEMIRGLLPEGESLES